LQAALAEKLPGATVQVDTNIRPRRSATEMVKSLPADLAAFKRTLVVWQTGTVDAVQAIDPDDFNEALETGIRLAHAAGADIILMNSQYSPRTETMIALGIYSENIRWVAAQQEIPLFDRYSIMKLWVDLGIFDLYASTKKIDIALRVHDCLGRLLADLVLDAVKPKAPPLDGIR
jgi:hypothetical protein